MKSSASHGFCNGNSPRNHLDYITPNTNRALQMFTAKTGQLAADVDLDAEMKKLQEQQDSRKKVINVP